MDRQVRPRHLRVFLASPGDVAKERALARDVLAALPYDPLLRGRVTLDIVAWDQAGAPMLATLTPQEAIAQGLPKPSQCDVAVVIFWSRMGTPLPTDCVKPDGNRYLSGTEWEFWDALWAAQRDGRPEVLLYRRSSDPGLKMADPEFDDKRSQWQQVEAFFAALRNPDGSIRQGYNSYATLEEFKDALDRHLRSVISRLLESPPPAPLTVSDAAASRPPPEALKALHEAVRCEGPPVDLPPEAFRDVVRHPPCTSVEYRLNRVAAWSLPRYALDKRFVRLTLLIDQGEEATGPRWAAQPQSFRDLGEVLEAAPDKPLVLLGPPGSGKSTLLRRFEWDCAVAALRNPDGKTPLTFFVQLNEYKPLASGELPPPREWLRSRWAARFSNMPDLEDCLRYDRLVLLLDALNELPRAAADSADLWKDFLAELAGTDHRIIFSCRTLDFSLFLSTPELPVPQVRIEALANEQVEEFLQRHSPEQGAAMWQALRNSPQLELLSLPYYLKLLVEEAEASGEIPQGRAALFTGFVRQALRRELDRGNPLFKPDALLDERDCKRMLHARTWRTPHELPCHGALFPKLAELAFRMQENWDVTEASQVRRNYRKALELLAHPEAEGIVAAGEALGVLEEDLDNDELLYTHQLFQEYFAARHLAAHPDPDRVKTAWQADKIRPSLAETLAQLADADPLPPAPATGWEETTVLAAAMAEDLDAFVADSMDANLPLAGRCAAQPDVRLVTDLKSRLQQALIERTSHPQADLRARIAAGKALGRLGDPRFERRRGPHGDYLLPPMVEIPGGTYRIGSDEGLYDDEAPVHEVELAPFALGRFPVTNAEWQCFIDAEGYDDERWWDTEAAKAWRSGESTAEGAKEAWRENRQLFQQRFDEIRERHRQGRITSKQADDWEQIARLSDDEFEALLDDWYPPGRQPRPAYWNDDAYNNPAQPVVGVCWYEARAYCAWLAAQTGRPFRLPTEPEWEAAARGRAGRCFAYGKDFDAALSNTLESHIRGTTPVGVFPGGETPEGLIDVTGNVWEWTGSLYQPYPYRTEDGPENPATEGRRVVRGGSWGDAQVAARAACRGYNPPDVRGDDAGLRVAVSSPTPPLDR